MKSISLNITKAASFLAEGAVKAYEPKVKAAQEALENGTCEGNDFLGWLHLPSSITAEFLDEIQAVANTLREKCEVVVVAGIGGSYLGARGVIECLCSPNYNLKKKSTPNVYFIGNGLSSAALREVMATNSRWLPDRKRSTRLTFSAYSSCVTRPQQAPGPKPTWQSKHGRLSRSRSAIGSACKRRVSARQSAQVAAQTGTTRRAMSIMRRAARLSV